MNVETPRTRKPAQVRRLEIAEAVLSLLGERGPAGLSTASIAAAVGLTTGALFRHYPSLDAMLEAAVDLAIARIESTLPSGDRAPVERLEELLRLRVEHLRAEPGLAWVLLSDQATALVPAAALARLTALVARSRAALLGALRAGAEAGSIRADVPPEVLLVLVSGAVHALARSPGAHAAAAPAPPSTEQVLAALRALLAPPHHHSERS